MLAEIVVARIKSLSLASLPLDISLSNTTTMASSDAEMDDSDTSSALTDFLRTETLEARSMMPAEFQQPPNDEATRNWVWVNGKQFLKVDHTANIRTGTTVSNIWRHGSA
jgi:hypothetical protein